MATLFYDTQTVVDNFMFVYSLKASTQFIECADSQLTRIFIKLTGLKPGKNVCFSLSSHYVGGPIYTEYQIENSNYLGRKLLINLYINHNWNPITIYWKSKTGKDYKLHDTEIDGSDIEFWFESLDAELYLKQLYPNITLPFKLKDLSYELAIIRLNLDCTIILEVKNEAISTIPAIVNSVDSFIDQFNQKSEKKDGEEGFIHNWKHDINNINTIVYDLDLGSAGFSFFKKLFSYLSKLSAFTKVRVE